MKIVKRYGAAIGSEATDGIVYFVVPMGANSLETIYFLSVDRTRAEDFILVWEFQHKIRPVPGV